MHRNSPVCKRQSKQCEEGWDGGRWQEALLRPCGSHQRGLHFPENKGRAMQSRDVASTSATEEQGGGAVLWPHTPPKLGESWVQQTACSSFSLLSLTCLLHDTHTLKWFKMKWLIGFSGLLLFHSQWSLIRVLETFKSLRNKPQNYFTVKDKDPSYASGGSWLFALKYETTLWRAVTATERLLTASCIVLCI